MTAATDDMARASRREFLRGGALTGLAFAAAGRAAFAKDRTLGNLSLRETFAETFEGPLSLWTPRNRRGRWKTNYFYGDPFGPSGRIANDEIVVDEAYCGINPFHLGDRQVELELARTALNDPRLGGKKLTAGLLTTERSFSQTYGYFECRFASPGIPGCWPAFWLYSAPAPDLTGKQWDNGLGFGREWAGGLNNEIDVVEILTNDTRKTYHTASVRHAWIGDKPGAGFDAAFKPSVEGPHIAVSEGTTSARTYGVLWTAEKIVWYVDEVEVFRAPNRGIHDPMYMIVSMGGGGWNGNVLAADFVSARMTVHSVMAYAIA